MGLDMTMDTFSHALVDALQTGKPAALATVVKTRGSTPRRPGAKMLIYPDGSFVGTVGGGVVEERVKAAGIEVLRERTARCVEIGVETRDDAQACGGEMEIFVEPLLTRPTLLLVGAGHVGAAVAQLAQFAGFRVVVLDDRPEFVTAENFPHADERIAGEPAAQLGQIEITPETYIVLATRSHALDPALLGAVLNKPAAFIGMLGSERRAKAAIDALKKQGVASETLTRLHAPIGLDIHAETPEEIAVSILAEIIKIERTRHSEQ